MWFIQPFAQMQSCSPLREKYHPCGAYCAMGREVLGGIREEIQVLQRSGRGLQGERLAGMVVPD